MNRGEMIDVLATTSLFGGVGRPVLEMVAAGTHPRVYPRDQFLWYQGDPGDRLIVVVDGLVKVVVHGMSGDQVVLAALGPPETLGELALVDRRPRSASVIAARTTTALLINRSVLLDLMQRDSGFLESMLSSLGSILRRLTEQTADMVFLDLGGRIAKLLLSLGEEHGRQSRGTTLLELRLTQTDLAQMVGATRPAVNRVLQSFVARRLISIDGHTITIHDDPALRRRAGL